MSRILIIDDDPAPQARSAMCPIVCQSEAMRVTLERIAAAADCDVPVLLTGESGTGKELHGAGDPRAEHAVATRRWSW